MENGLQRGVGSVVGEIGRTGQVAPVQTNTDLMKFATASANLTKALGGKVMELAQAKQSDLEKQSKGVLLSELKLNLTKNANTYAEEYTRTNKLDVAQMDFDTEEAMRYIDGTKYLSDTEKEQLKLDHKTFRENVKSDLIKKDIVYQKELNITTTLVGLDDTLNMMDSSIAEGNSVKTAQLFEQYKENLFNLQKIDPIKYNDKVIKEALISGVVKNVGGALNRDLDELYVKVTNGELTSDEFNDYRKQYINDYYSSSGYIKEFFKENGIEDEEAIDELQKKLMPMLNQIGSNYESKGLKEVKKTQYDRLKAEQGITNGISSYANDEIVLSRQQVDKQGNIVSSASSSGRVTKYQAIESATLKGNRESSGSVEVIDYSEARSMADFDRITEEYFYRNKIQSLNSQEDIKRAKDRVTDLTNVNDIVWVLADKEGYSTSGEFINKKERVEYAKAGIIPLYADVYNKKDRTQLEKEYTMFEDERFNSPFKNKEKRMVNLPLSKMRNKEFAISSKTKLRVEVTSKLMEVQSLRERNSGDVIERDSYDTIMSNTEDYTNILINEKINSIQDSDKIGKAISEFNDDPGKFLDKDDIEKIGKYIDTQVKMHAQSKSSVPAKINGVLYNKPEEIEEIKPTEYINSVLPTGTEKTYTTVLQTPDGKAQEVTESQKTFLSHNTFIVDSGDRDKKFIGYEYDGKEGRLGVNYTDEEGKTKNYDVVYDTKLKESFIIVEGEYKKVKELIKSKFNVSSDAGQEVIKESTTEEEIKNQYLSAYFENDKEVDVPEKVKETLEEKGIEEPKIKEVVASVFKNFYENDVADTLEQANEIIKNSTPEEVSTMATEPETAYITAMDVIGKYGEKIGELKNNIKSTATNFVGKVEEGIINAKNKISNVYDDTTTKTKDFINFHAKNFSETVEFLREYTKNNGREAQEFAKDPTTLMAENIEQGVSTAGPKVSKWESFLEEVKTGLDSRGGVYSEWVALGNEDFSKKYKGGSKARKELAKVLADAIEKSDVESVLKPVVYKERTNAERISKIKNMKLAGRGTAYVTKEIEKGMLGDPILDVIEYVTKNSKYSWGIPPKTGLSRTAKEQAELYASGTSNTILGGNHLSGNAVDLVPVDKNGNFDWNSKNMRKAIEERDELIRQFVKETGVPIRIFHEHNKGWDLPHIELFNAKNDPEGKDFEMIKQKLGMNDQNK